jgi:hypothetical protein
MRKSKKYSHNACASFTLSFQVSKSICINEIPMLDNLIIQGLDFGTESLHHPPPIYSYLTK